ncbi:uncharacterized protein LOC127004902 [Eriocheir sinensis]|uniref:uncharacterized protein LOC127004902 n=1 Tax=Eriocheir sinensis TaxID=95602 RepID=UPI0021C82E0F|nr:uncharacterized protein LOC127004902 [Eriocheir sinensis]
MVEIIMVELKTKVRVTTLCFCNGTIHHHHTTTNSTTPPPHRRRILLPPPAPPPTPPTPPVSPPPGQGKMPTHASRIVRKYRKSRLKRVKRQEFKKLRDMVPALQEKPVVTKVEVIEEAIKYIDQLHSALIERFRTRGLPPTLRDLPLEAREVHGGNIREVVRRLLAASTPSPTPTLPPPARLENARALPTFIHKLGKARRL